MTKIPDQLQIPTHEDYVSAVDIMDEEYAAGSLHSTIDGMARKLPDEMTIQIGMLASKMNAVDRQTLTRRHDQHDLCRALASGASMGIMMGQILYNHTIYMGKDVWFNPLSVADNQSYEFEKMVIAQTEQSGRIIGDTAYQRLDDLTIMMATDIDKTRMSRWYVTGATRTLMLLHQSAETYNKF